jgi:peptide/nickel transport system permease protein
VNTSMDSISDSSLLEGDVKARSLWSDAFRRFRQNWGAVIGLGVVLFMVLVAVFAPWIATQDPVSQNLRDNLAPPSAEHLFGTDEFGRDLFSRVVYGSRISLPVGIIAVALAAFIGIPLGLISAYYGRWVDLTIMRLVDILLAFPGMLLALAVMAILGPDLSNAVIAAGIFVVPDYIRVTRSSVLSVKEMEYVMSARAIGSRDLRIMTRHILPNALLPLIVLATLQVGSTILFVASLSFLGLGAKPPTPEWGALLTVGRRYMREAWWIAVFPGLAIMITILGINMFGNGLRDALDPYLTIKK